MFLFIIRTFLSKLSHESEGMDIKLGPGGIEEIEFYVQFLQLYHAIRSPEILVQNTTAAINRLAKKEILNPSERKILLNSYRYYRKLEALLRQNEEQVVAEQSEVTDLLVNFMGHKTREEFLSYLGSLRDNVSAVSNRK